MIPRPWIRQAPKALLLVAGVGLLLLGLMKLTNRADFIATMAAHDLLPAWTLVVISWTVVLAEVGLGVVSVWTVMSSPRSAAAALLGIAIFLLAMAVYAAGLWLDPPPGPVSCGYIPNAPPVDSWMPVTIRNSTLSALFACAARLARPPEPRAALTPA